MPARYVFAAAILILATTMTRGQRPAGPVQNEIQAGSATALTLRDAVAIALEKNSERKIALAQSELAHSQSRLARIPLFPSFSIEESIQRGNDPVYVFGTNLRQQRFTQQDFALNSLNRPLPVNNFTTRFSGSWVAFDSLATQHSIHRADLLQKSAAAALTRADQRTVHATVRAYEEVLYALRQQQVAEHAVETAEALHKSSSDRVDAGVAVDADRIAAAAYVAERRQEEIEAEGRMQIAWAELEAALGTGVPLERRRLLPLRQREYAVATLDNAIVDALRSRPDRKSVDLEHEAWGALVAESKSAFGPKISSFGSWETDRPSIVGSGGNNWVAGVEMRVDLLPLAQRENLRIARVRQMQAQAAVDSAGQQIRLEVTRAWYQLASANQSIEVARTSSQQTDEGLRIARDRYEAGLATMTDLLRIEDLQRQSETSYWQAVFRTALAYADLQFATGTLNQNAAGDLQ